MVRVKQFDACGACNILYLAQDYFVVFYLSFYLYFICHPHRSLNMDQEEKEKNLKEDKDASIQNQNPNAPTTNENGKALFSLFPYQISSPFRITGRLLQVPCSLAV